MSWHGASWLRVLGIAEKAIVVASCASKAASTAASMRSRAPAGRGMMLLCDTDQSSRGSDAVFPELMRCFRIMPALALPRSPLFQFRDIQMMEGGQLLDGGCLGAYRSLGGRK